MKNFLNTKFVIAIMMVASGLSLISCHREEDSTEQKFNDNFVAIDVSNVGKINKENLVTNKSSSNVLRSKYTTLYYYYQYNDNPGANYCGPTSYMVATKSVAAYNGISYTMNKTNQLAIASYTGASPSPYNLFNHWNQSSNGYKTYMTCNYARGSNTHPNNVNETTRTNIKAFIENSLAAGKLIIMPVKIKPGNLNKSYNDGTISGSSSSEINNYISKYGNAGHYIVLYGLDRSYNADGYSIGTAYYLDVYHPDAAGATKTVNYLRLLDANVVASSSGSIYSAMWFGDPYISLY